MVHFVPFSTGRQDDDGRGDGLWRLLAALPGLLHRQQPLSRDQPLPVHPGKNTFVVIDTFILSRLLQLGMEGSRLIFCAMQFAF